MLPNVFITADTEPAKSPPRSSVMAHDTPTVSSSPNTAPQKYPTLTHGSAELQARGIITAANRNPLRETTRRDILRFPERRRIQSETPPPHRSPTNPASSGALAYRPICCKLNPR